VFIMRIIKKGQEMLYINVDHTQQMFMYIKGNPDCTEEQIVGLLISEFGYCQQKAFKWLESFKKALFSVGMIEEITFDSIKIIIESFLLSTEKLTNVCKIVQTYLEENPTYFKHEDKYFVLLTDIEIRMAFLQREKKIYEEKLLKINNLIKTLEEL